ncbi:PaaI family thioesterase [Roseibaca sp. V10]|uniref:PaaI family thioesterase n=2 Tax=Roseinatronobacter domitianus TaxID=2940293 RepID=A0ABT0M642_9RHOB|nr:PaaI family thioesterase [Roseibaca domitiana]MCL1629764.1 PaaI family thioesterase [Roseibaca domitiana]
MIMDRNALNAFLDSDFAEVAQMFRVDAAQDNALTLRLLPSPAHLRPGGTVSGPTLFALADVAVYLTILSMIGPKALTVTTNAGMDFMRKPPAGVDLLCETRLLKLGRVLAVGDALIYAEGNQRPVARASMTYSIPPEG